MGRGFQPVKILLDMKFLALLRKPIKMKFKINDRLKFKKLTKDKIRKL